MPDVNNRRLPNGDQRCLADKPVIVATHMPVSMIENPVPTSRNTDVANAVFEQADAISVERAKPVRAATRW